MEITDVKIYRVDGDKLKAYASVIFNNCFIIKDLKIISGKNGLYVAMPNKKTKEGFKDIVHPINKEMRDLLEETIIQKYLTDSPES